MTSEWVGVPRAADHREDLVLQHQLVGDVAGVGGVVPVVLDHVLDLAAVDPAVGVDVLELRLRAGGISL